jgi:hypothetical protein
VNCGATRRVYSDGTFFDAGWWSYVRYQYPERLLVGGCLLAAALAVAGYLSVAALGNQGPNGAGLITTTRYGGVRVLHVVQTVARFQTRTLPGGTRVSVRRFIRYRPVYRQRVVRVNGKPVTVKQLVGRKAVTVSNVVTSGRTNTVVQSRTQTVDQTQTVTRTETGATRTITVTVTTTGPGATVTETLPTTVTVTTTCKSHGC